MEPMLKSSTVIKRHPANPVLSRKDIPYPATLIFNAGVAKYQGRYVMVFRNDYGRWGDQKFDGTNLGFAYSREPLLAPEAQYETDEGFRTHVIFPGGMILEESGEVKIYYGAADTVECLATAHVDDLIALCTPVSMRLH